MAISNKDLYNEMTARVIARMEEGFIPWRKPWVVDANGLANMPMNLCSKKAYRGVNVWLLGMMGFSSPWWMTFNQAKELGGSVKAGSKGSKVYFWQFFKRQKKDSNGKPMTENGLPVIESIPMLKVYTVFNLEQVEGIEAPKVEVMPVRTMPEKIGACEDIIKGYDMPVSFGGNRACYSPSDDRITMPMIENFDKVEEYYSTYFHELTHSTGHKSRLAREGVVNISFFGSHSYSKEELVAEFGASFLCGMAGIENATIDNSVAYLQSWINALKRDPALLIQAAGQAQKACDLILGIKHDEVKEETEMKEVA